MEQTMEQSQVADPVHSAEHAMNATQESLDRVREILFGAQIREQDHRRHEFEEQMAKQLAAFGDESRKRLESLEAFVKREIASLLDVLKAESVQRADALRGLAEQLQHTAAGIDRRIAALDEQHSGAERALRSELLDQSKTLRDDLSGLSQSFAALLDKTRADLQDAKMDRAALAGFYSEMAKRLST